MTTTTRKIIQGNFTLNVNFNLRQTKPENVLTPINAVIRFNNQRIVVSGIDKIEPRFWNSDKQAPRQHAANKRAREISISISDAKTRITEVFENYIAENRKYPEDLTAFLKRCKCKVFDLPEGAESVSVKKNESLIVYIDDFVNDIQGNKRVISTGRSKGKPYAKNSSKTYTNLLFNIKAFQKHTGVNDIRFTDIDLDFYTDFRQYLIVNRNLTPNYFGDLVKALKAVMSDAAERGYHNNKKHTSRHFIKESTEADTIFLDKDKLQILLKLDLENKPALDKARNLFLIGCFSGLRFSDFSNIKPENIDTDYLRIRTQKTKDYLSIPISNELRIVLNRYNEGLIEPISNQKLNEYIKDVCEEAGFKEPVSIRKYQQGKEIYVKVPFYQLVSSHTARRSWATNAFKAGYPTLLIQNVTGHKTETAFLKYIRLNNEDKSAIMLELIRRNELKLVGGAGDAE